MGIASSLIFKLLLVTAASPVLGGPAPTDPVAITGGQSVNTCGWPAVVYLSGNGFLCTGTLIHPEIIATAAHCIEVMEPNTLARFGDFSINAQDLAPIEYCMASPDFVSTGDGTIPFSEVQNDWGFCKLAEPVTEVVPVPVAYGCEMDNVVAGATLVRAGFGKLAMANNQFNKRWVETPINAISFTDPFTGWPTQLSEGGGGVGTCPGDSGGPGFIAVPTRDGGEAWRMVAIQSTQPVEDGAGNEIECGTEPNNTAVIAQGVAFIEDQSGIDITPCFDQAGNWDPTFECQGFPIDPGAGGGTWAMGCDTGPLTGFSDACGPTFPELSPDALAPTVALVEPPEDLVVDYNGTPVEIHVLAEADDGDGWGMAHVALLIVDADTDTELAMFDDADAAYEWDAQFPKGAFRIYAIGYDNAGLMTETESRMIYVGVDPPTDDGTAGTDTGADEGLDDAGTSDGGDAGTAGAGSGGQTGSDGGGDDGTGVSSDGGGIARGGDDTGCGCRTTPDDRGSDRGWPLWLWVLLPAFVRGRRRGVARRPTA